MRLPHLSRVLCTFVLGAGLCACPDQPSSSPAPPVTELEASGGVDPEVIELLNARIDLAKARPTDASRRRDLALAYEANGLWTEAVASWGNAVQMKPGEFVWQYHYASAVDGSGEASRAIGLMAKLVETHPELAAAQHHYGMLLLDEGRYEEAREPFTVARAQVSHIPFSAVGLADVEFHLDNFAAAERFAREALELDQGYRYAHFVLGKALRAQGKRQEAERELNLGMEAKPGYVPSPLNKQLRGLKRGFTVRMNEAGDLIDQHRPKEAIKVLTEVVRLYPEDLPARVNLAVAYTHDGQPAKSKELLLEVLDVEPEHFGAYINLAAAEIDLNQTLEAMRHVNKAIAVAPDIGRGYLVKAQIYAAMGNLDEAYATLQKAQVLDTTDPQVQIKLGNVASAMGNDELAIEHFEKALEIAPEDIASQLNIAKLYIRLRRSEEATAAYRRAKETDPDHPLVKDFEQWWASISGGGKR